MRELKRYIATSSHGGMMETHGGDGGYYAAHEVDEYIERLNKRLAIEGRIIRTQKRHIKQLVTVNEQLQEKMP